MDEAARIRVEVTGTVQGVGFRPFLFRLAGRHRLSGWVRNTPRGVELEAEGVDSSLQGFLADLQEQPPPLSRILAMEVTPVPLAGGEGFEIRNSCDGPAGGELPPDRDLCPECLRELFDPADRRYRYPFINCTDCGPRYSIIRGVPYDRPLTTMAPFPLCRECRREYENPLDRRYHAEPTSCPDCGPRLRLLRCDGQEICGDPVAQALLLLEKGNVLAVKSVGGFHLAVDPTLSEAVAELRRRKRREEKPFALLARDLEMLREFAEPDAAEERFLLSGERPIVLVQKKGGSRLSPLVAPGSRTLGIMLPSNPLQHLLMEKRRTPLVMTSGNRSGEPTCFRNSEATGDLAGVADAFLLHDREIASRADDSVLRICGENALFLRRGRGWVPRGITLPLKQPPVLAVGGEMKSTLCLTRGGSGYLSSHIGKLNTAKALEALREAAQNIQRLLRVAPEGVAHDLHPDYLSTHFAQEFAALPRFGVQHHHAHMASCMAENLLEGEAIGIVFDGTGYGTDGTIWGGEFLVGGYAGVRRRGRLSKVAMPGGETAVREPRRMALSYLSRAYAGEAIPLPLLSSFSPAELHLLLKAMEKGINSPLTSSCGRLFDAAAAILGVREIASYEGQAAMELEGMAEIGSDLRPYPFRLRREEEVLVLDLLPAIRGLADDVMEKNRANDLARRFHATLAAGAAAVCGEIADETGLARVVLTGGVFQNRLLLEHLSKLLQERGLQVYVHRLVPPGDGGLSLGQAVVAGWRMERGDG